MTLFKQNKVGDALRIIEESWNIVTVLYPKQDYPDGHVDIALCLNNKGAMLLSLGRSEAALPF